MVRRTIGQAGLAVIIGVLAVTGLVRRATAHADAGATPVLDYLATPVPSGLDTLASLADAARQWQACDRERECEGLLYVWSPLLPLSRAGITDISAAARELELPLTVMGGAELYGRPNDGGRPEFAARLRATGATVHYPAVIVHRDGEPVGDAILGYKTAETYRAMIAARLDGATTGHDPATASNGVSTAARAATTLDPATTTVDSPGTTIDPALSSSAQLADRQAVDRQAVDHQAAHRPAAPRPTYRDVTVEGRPSVYFRGVPGTNLLAYESLRQVYLLDLADGRAVLAPGYVDFIPSPDGRFFVTPAPGRAGLDFYDTGEVLGAGGAEAKPFFRDPMMRDQYPSVGILERRRGADGDVTIYRVLTSWYDKVVFRDYEVAAGSRPRVRPLGDAVPACSNLRVSLPIMTRDGLELAGRNEDSGSTALFRLRDDGTCQTLLDLGVPTSKVGFSADGRKIAFGIPRGAVRDGRGRSPSGLPGPAGAETTGIFVLDRDAGSTTRVPWSQEATPLAFPDFLDGGEVVFLIPASDRAPSRFRIVDLGGM
jgi:hypothetical protein